MPEFVAKLTSRGSHWMTERAKKNTAIGVVTFILTLGLGTWISVLVVPWTMRRVDEAQAQATANATAAHQFAQTKMVELMERSIVGNEQTRSSIQANTSKMDELIDSHEDLCGKLERLVDVQTKAATK